MANTGKYETIGDSLVSDKEGTVSTQGLHIRKIYTIIDETRDIFGVNDPGGALRRVAACAVITNLYAGRGLVKDLTALIEPSRELGYLLGTLALQSLGSPAESYGKAAIAGTAGEQEHAVACITSVFGNALRESLGGARAWIPSTSKVGPPGTAIDVPLAFKDELWVRSHYDALEVRVPDAPLPDEIVVIVVLANRGRLHARLGGLTKEEALAALHTAQSVRGDNQ